MVKEILRQKKAPIDFRSDRGYSLIIAGRAPTPFWQTVEEVRFTNIQQVNYIHTGHSRKLYFFRRFSAVVYGVQQDRPKALIGKPVSLTN